MNSARSDGTCVVLGAGVTGLATAYRLAEAGRKVELVEASDRIGGASRTFRWGEFLVDTGPHKVYTTLEGILESVRELLGEELLEVPKQTSIQIQSRTLDYPFRPLQLLTRLSPLFGLSLFAGYLQALWRERNRPEVSYEDWIVKRFGWGLYRCVFEGLAEKIWSHPRELSADLARRRIVTPGMWALLVRVLLGRSHRQAPAPVFLYPRMGIGRLNDRLAERIVSHGGEIALSQSVQSILCRNGRVRAVRLADRGGSRETPVEQCISTIPLARMIEALDPPAPARVLQAARRLRIRPIMLAFISFEVPRLLRDVWMFFPDKRWIFNRLSEQKGFSEAMAPADKTVVCFDITAGHMPEAWDWPAEKVLDRCLADLRGCGLYRGEKVLQRELFKIPDVYPIYDLRYRENLGECLRYLEGFPNLFTTGRAGLFCYNNVDQCLDMGYRLARHILREGTQEDLRGLLSYFDGYEIVD